uniref:Uncharacterized protein n=1 Tax=Ditylum brightwellii TaxID=49249 RepID=A0A6S9IC40_9STRA|mmetsp:Transcript_2346/g.3125  ORF Transcript_2346/g.3125 Transcript_2346/m.3125 type:complete len:408 (+) Transcript_2346:309-1532(+)
MKSTKLPSSSQDISNLASEMAPSPAGTLLARPSIGNLFNLDSKSILKDSVKITATPGDTITTKREKGCQFGASIRQHTYASPDVPNFDQKLRNVIEPYVGKARKEREQKQREMTGINDVAPIACNVGVPYPTLRRERAFLFDSETYPLHRILAETLGVPDLSMLHTRSIQDERILMEPLLHRSTRRAFHECYDNFVASFCIPLLHAVAIEQNIFNISTMASAPMSTRTAITYRYQAFPCLRIVRPGESSTGPHCDIADGHSIGNINFHIPLTPVYGTNAIYTESHPGREDWHPLTAKSLGLGYVFDGARCLHFGLENTTETTRVSLDFRIAISRGGSMFNDDPNNKLCSRKVLNDQFEAAGPGYYEEVFIDIDSTPRAFAPGPVVVKKGRYGGRLSDPDHRVGFPFT